MKILDEHSCEIREEDVDLNKGYLVPDYIIIKHHEAIPAQSEEFHYECGEFYFDDGTKLDVSSLGNNDPHVKIVDLNEPIFEYIDQGEGKTCQGMTIRRIIDKEATLGVDAWNETEPIKRYIKFTPSEIEERHLAQEKEQKTEKFLVEGPTALAATAKVTSDNSTSIEDINLLIADLIGA